MAQEYFSRGMLLQDCRIPSRGIDKSLVLEGYFVFATARKVEVLEDLKQLGITTLQLDVTDLGSVHRARDAVAKLTGGSLDILFNNACVV